MAAAIAIPVIPYCAPAYRHPNTIRRPEQIEIVMDVRPCPVIVSNDWLLAAKKTTNSAAFLHCKMIAVHADKMDGAQLG